MPTYTTAGKRTANVSPPVHIMHLKEADKYFSLGRPASFPVFCLINSV